jgi:MYXO-CTERM domain-containing protein
VAWGTKVLGAAWLVAALACEGSSGAPEAQQPEGYRGELASHKVQLTAEQAQKLEQSGARVQELANYGAFKVVQVDQSALAALPEGAELRDDYNDILLNAGTIDTQSKHGQSLRGMKLQATGKGFHIVQFVGPIQPEWVQQLEATGVKLVSYIPNNAYIVYGDVAALTSLQRHVSATKAIQWNADYLDDYKLNPTIFTVRADTYTVQLIKDEKANGPTLELIRARQSRNGVIQEALGYVNVVAYLTVKDLYEIAARPDVFSITPRPKVHKLDERQDIILTGQLTANAPTGPGYLAWLASKGFTQAQFTASGFGVDVSDSGMDNGTQAPNHFGLYMGGDVTGTSRVVYNRLEGTPNAGSTIQGCDGHGNLNTHIIAGYSNKTGAPFTDATGFTHGLGVAPFVKVGSSVVFDPGSFTDPDYEDLQSRAYRDGMRVSSNSWGANSNLYDADAQRYDALVRDAQPTGSAVPNAGNQEMVILFAAGNAGSSANTVGTPGTAKNIITVGASENVRAFGAPDLCAVADTGADNANDIIGFSSRGPASDGRKKPDIVAPGTHISGGVAQTAGQRAEPPAVANGSALSCFDASGVCGGPGIDFYPAGQQWYTASSGTSHSTPAVAGGTALVRQYFINQGIAPPSAAMTKAYLMNSAHYMTGVGANDNLYSNNQGMGLMDLGMAFDGIKRLLDDQNPANLLTASGQTRTFSGVVSDSTKPFRVTLGWTDAPGSTTGSAWKNNLDLTVTLAGNTYKGNVFTGGNSVTGGAADGSNNVESVFLPAGIEGAYTVTVTGTNINSDGVPGNASALDQDFALIAYNSCATATPVPTGVSATANGNNRIDVSWTANGSTSYNIYRSTTAGGPYTRVATAPASPYSDTGVSGSTTYYYVVRAVQCAESAKSVEVSATAAGQCTLAPTFAGIATASNSAASTCANAVTWAAATPICGGTLSYSVYRSTTSGFVPALGNRIATGLAGLTFSDDLNLTNGTTYYYVVRATETSNAVNQDTNTVQKSAVPTGAVTPGVRYFDDLDSNRPTNPSAYWIATTQSGTAGTINITTGCHYQSATKSYRFGAANTTCGGAYPVSTQATLSLGGDGTTAGINGFTIPASSLGPQMSFNLWYSTEDQYDGAWLVYSTVGAAGPWTQVLDTASTTAPYITAGGYDDVLDSSATTPIWTNTNMGANGALKAVSVNLSGVVGQKVWFGFKFFSDITVTAEGVYLDDVRITADSFASCTTRLPPPGPAASYRVTGLPATIGAGTATTFTVTALDSVGQTATGYTGTAAITSTDAQAVLPANVTFVAGVASNVAITFRTLGTQSVTAKDTTAPALTGSGSTSVTAGPPTALAFLQQPSNSAAGVSITPAVQVIAVDQFGNPVTTATNSVTLALGNNPGGSTLGGTTTVAMASGVATFSNLTLNKPGTGYTLTASSTGLTGVTSSGFNIVPGAPAKLVFTIQPTTTGANASITPAVQVAIQDSVGNLTNSTANVTLALGNNPTGATLSGTTTVAAVAGVATFSNLSLNRGGNGYTLAATSASLTGATSSAFNIVGGTPYRVLITRQPSNTTAGATITPSIQATVYDVSGNVVGSANNAITVSLGNNPAGGTLGGTTTVNAVAGVADFANLSVDRVGVNYTLVAGSSGLFADSSVGFDVGVGAASQLAFTASPTTNVGSGAAFTVKVAVRDAGGNLVTTASAPVTLALLNAAGATLSGTKVATPVGGVATFTGLSVDKVGSGYQLQATATGLTTATSTAFGVDPGVAAALAFTTQPGNTASGALIAPAVRVEVRDAQGNTVTSSSASITLAFGTNPASGTLGGTKTVAAINGVATFADLTVDKVGTGYTLKATAGALTATSSAFNVTAGAAAKLVFRTPPANAVAGAVLGSVAVEVQDAQGNLTASTAQVTLTLGGATGGTLGGTTTVAAVNGVATFSTLFIQKAATGFTLTAGGTALTSVTSGPFNITPAAAAALSFSVQPSTVAAGASIAPAVAVSIQDSFGNVVTSATNSVTLALAANPSGGTLSGTATAAAVNGVATFANLSINRAGTGYKLNATSGALTGASSAAFDALAGNAARLVFKLSPASTTAGSPLGAVTVEVQDTNGNVVNTNASITLALQGAQGGTLSGTTTVAAVNGVASFPGLSVAKVGTGYQLVAHGTGLVDGTSTAFDISHGAAALLVFSVQPSTARAGTAISPAVKVSIQDAFGNVATSATSPVTVAIGNNPRNGTLSGTLTVSAINGVATFGDLSINRNGTGYTLQASSGALTAATSTAFEISHGNAPKLVFRTTPASVNAGDLLASIEVELRDELDNVYTDSTASVTLSLGDNAPGAQLLGVLTAPVVNGVAKFDGLSLRKVGAAYTLVASTPGFASASSSAFAVKPGAAASFTLSLAPSVTAGQEATLSAIAYDAYGNQASSYGGTVNVSSTDTAAAYAATGTFVEGVLSGVKVTFKSAGLRSLTLTDANTASLTATAQLNVTPFAQPTVAVSDPVGGTTVSGTVSISATGAVATGTTLAKLSIMVDGVEIATGTDAKVTGSWDSSKASAGAHIITAVITDGAGNMAASTPVVVSTEESGGCGCGTTSGTDASIYLGLLVLARYALGRRRAKLAA